MLTTPNMLSEALSYARRGWPVFPCDPDNKEPLVGRDKDANGKPIEGTGGVKKATTDERQIREWWGRWPHALIGVALGGKMGLWVVDLDHTDPPEPIEDVEARLVAAVGKLTPGPRSRTQSGGIHIWLKLPAGDIPRNSAKRMQNIDWRAEGGYVIVPPSVMSNGAKYEWIVSPDVADFPEPNADLIDLVMKRGKFAPPKTEKKKGNAGHVPEDNAVRRYCLLALDKAAQRVAALADGARNTGLNNEALGVGHLVGAGGITEAEADDALRSAAYSWGIGDDDKALKPGGTLERALRDGAAKPADLSHVGLRTSRSERAPEYEPGVDYDADTGEFPDPETETVSPGPPDDQEDIAARNKFPFRALGFNKDSYFYFSQGKQQITELKAGGHTTLALLQLADLNYWSKNYLATDGKLSKEQWLQIANSLMQECHHKGLFTPKRVRGRGAWVDGSRVIVHMGDLTRVNGEPVPLNDVPGRYIYEAAEPWEFEFGAGATTKQAHMLADICQRLTWQEPMSGALLAGWCIVAPVCGALRWRPHVWITGPSKAGKTTAVKEIAGRLVGPAAMEVEGKATEAGIRQTMGPDALPIILDEAESEDDAAVRRMQDILDLARVSSSGGMIAKGSQSGRAVHYVVRSCFLFSSINTALKHHADESRVTRLTLTKNTGVDALTHYQALMHDIDATFTPEYAGAMFARTVENLPTLLANIETFKMAASVVFGDRRAGDQIGPMLAGYYLCHSTSRIELAEAEKFIRRHDWTDYAALDSTSDEMRLLSHLMTRQLRVSLTSGAARELSVGQAIYECRDELHGEAYSRALGSRGIKVDYDSFTISNGAKGVADMLRGTPWVSDWKRPLSDLTGAEKTKSAVYFAPGLVTRGVRLPTGILMEG